MILIYLKNWCFETNKNKWCKHKTIIILMYFWQIPNLAAWYFWSDIYSYCFFLISLVKWKLISSVHVLRFSEGAVPCPFLKDKNAPCLLLKVKIAPCPFIEVKNVPCLFSEMKNKPCPFPTISRARKLDSWRKS